MHRGESGAKDFEWRGAHGGPREKESGAILPGWGRHRPCCETRSGTAGLSSQTSNRLRTRSCGKGRRKRGRNTPATDGAWLPSGARGRCTIALPMPDEYIAIRQLCERYVDAINRRDAEAWINTWAPDGVWEYGGDNPPHGQSELARFWEQAMENITAVVMLVNLGGRRQRRRRHRDGALVPHGGRTDRRGQPDGRRDVYEDDLYASRPVALRQRTHDCSTAATTCTGPSTPICPGRTNNQRPAGARRAGQHNPGGKHNGQANS